MIANFSMPESKNMTPQAEDILEIIKAKGSWIRRSEIASELGKSRLNTWDISILDMLIERELIDAKKREIHGGIGFAWAYKATTSP